MITNKAEWFIEKWIESKKGCKDESKKNVDNWIHIAKEIFNRKSLLYSAKQDLEDIGISERSFEVAATDVFVEKAQVILTSRAKMFFWIAGLITFINIAMLAIIIFLLEERWTVDTNVTNGFVFTLMIIRNVTIATIILAIAYVLVSLARAFFHEGLVLYNRRHALRFGRLYVYLKKDKINFKDLEEAFKWNTEFSTAFRDINAEAITKTILGKVIETLPDIVKSYSNNSDSSNQTKNDSL